MANSAVSTTESVLIAPGIEVLAYAQIVADVTISATSAATAAAVITASAITLDGLTQICVETFAPGVLAGTSAGSTVLLLLFNGETQVGIIGVHGRGTGTTGNPYNTHYARTLLTPSAGSHTYSLRAYRGTSNGAISADSGGDDQFFPAYMRITKENQSVILGDPDSPSQKIARYIYLR